VVQIILLHSISGFGPRSYLVFVPCFGHTKTPCCNFCPRTKSIVGRRRLFEPRYRLIPLLVALVLVTKNGNRWDDGSRALSGGAGRCRTRRYVRDCSSFGLLFGGMSYCTVRARFPTPRKGPRKFRAISGASDSPFGSPCLNTPEKSPVPWGTHQLDLENEVTPSVSFSNLEIKRLGPRCLAAFIS
jgi:hypothetical protein